MTPTIVKMPKHWIELDEGSIDRAIIAAAEIVGWPAYPVGSGGSAEYLVAAVMRALETPREQPTAVIEWETEPQP